MGFSSSAGRSGAALSWQHAKENRISGVPKADDRGTAAPAPATASPRAEPAPPGTGPKLLDRMREALRSRHYSRPTAETYCHWVKAFIYFHIRKIQELLGHKDASTTMIYTQA
jgi:integrase